MVQGKETNAFLALLRKYEHCMIVLSNSASGLSFPKLFQVKAHTDFVAKAFEVNCVTANLNSGDCFLLIPSEGSAVNLWAGKASSAEEQKMAADASQIMGTSFKLIHEGQEDDSFWTYLGGKGD